MPNIVSRFAPSPTGLLHLGHAYSAWAAWKDAWDANGRFLLRLEDIDGTRCKPEFSDAIFEDLGWLGFHWEEPVLHQSRQMAVYADALDQLQAQDLLYPCFCTRTDIQKAIAVHEAETGSPNPQGPDGPHYPGTCKELTKAEAKARIAGGEAYALRLHTDRAIAQAEPLFWKDRQAGRVSATPEIFGDVILARKDTPTSYHLAVTIDDARQGITVVTRGQDLFDATHVHRLLQDLLSLPTPAYHHHRLLAGEDGKRFAKRDKSQSLRDLREQGKTPSDIWQMIGITPGEHP